MAETGPKAPPARVAEQEKKMAGRTDKLPSDAVADEPSAAETQRLVQKVLDEGNEKGFIGEQVDETPNHAYSLENGGNPGVGTPEVNPDNYKR